MSDLYYERPRSDDNCPRDSWIFDQDNFPNALQFLNWQSYPCRSLPQAFRANNLVGLELPRSRITKLWESGEREVLKQLRFLNLSGSKLRSLDLGMTPNLERLNLKQCLDLTQIHAPPDGCLERLVYLNLVGCLHVNSFSCFQQLESLELLSLVVTVNPLSSKACDNLPKLSFACFYLKDEDIQKSVFQDLQPATKLESVSGSFFSLQHLRHLTIKGYIPELPNDLNQLPNLEELNLVETHIKCLPDSILMLKHLRSLKLKDCQVLGELPRELGQLVCLEKLILCGTSIRCLPDSIYMLKHLESLELMHCEFLEELPRDLGQVELLEKLILRGCRTLKDIPNSICNMKRLKVLNIEYTRIRHLPHSISSLEGLHIAGSVAVLQSCVSATEIQQRYRPQKMKSSATYKQ